MDTELQQLAKMDRNPVEETRYQQLLKEQGSGGGGYSFNPKPYDDLMSNLPKATEYAATLDSSENQAMADYFGYLKSQPTPLDFYTKMTEAAGIPQLRQTQKTLQSQIYSLEDSLRRIEPDISATTGNSLVTEAQRRGMIEERAKPVREALGWQSQSLGRVSDAITNATQDAMNLTGLQEQGVERMSGAYKTKLSVIADQNARKMTGFTTDMQNTLNITLAKIARSEAVSDQQAQQAFELLKLEKQYQLEKNKLEEEYKLKDQYKDTSLDTEIVTVGGRKKLINKQTGEVISDLGSSSENLNNNPYLNPYLNNTNSLPSNTAPRYRIIG